MELDLELGWQLNAVSLMCALILILTLILILILMLILASIWILDRHLLLRLPI